MHLMTSMSAPTAIGTIAIKNRFVHSANHKAMVLDFIRQVWGSHAQSVGTRQLEYYREP
ncbi:hypothetical protein DSCW_32180 [Desulfosarcina widdelii]|uniref:Uncharacterized protein n=1 Tax=Desulfosarcina widdelii TaxID=947919 RepID=A0A5K7Z7W2_9BACT|nr:hypothetical protein [Desulfosarcina widdelii]BBO75801.1 hypothetical protein DSCW_32180 [Desulfosarcina widdelii]